MKIDYLQISNILSFRYVADISQADKIVFDAGLNIIIGENGSGKSTALETINFIFRRVLLKQYNLNREGYARRLSLNDAQRKDIFQPVNSNSLNGLRLEPNWDSVDEPQKIRIAVTLDDIDRRNIELLRTGRNALGGWASRYSHRGITPSDTYSGIYTLEVTLDRANSTFSVHCTDSPQDLGFEYLTEYNFFREGIALYNLEHPEAPLVGLYESFTLIGGYRNFHAFSASVSLKEQDAGTQMQSLRVSDFSRSLNSNENSEPGIFSFVRLRVAEKHFELISQKMNAAECEASVNEMQFIKDINERLQIINLKCKIKLLDLRTWQYSFEFYDLRRNRALADINSLSAGQKAILHLVFEAYGRGDLRGGLVIIDEPEIHLHYQFQHEYLKVIRDLNESQQCQYLLVTHSEALINSDTIGSVRRFALTSVGHTEFKCPRLTADEKVLIRVLDNFKSTYAFFAKKVVLVEGDSDRYFYTAMLHELYPNLGQDIAVLYVGGKSNFAQWDDLFSQFGLAVYRIADLDYAYNLFYPNEPKTKLTSANAVTAFKVAHPDCEARIHTEYENGILVLSNGDLEMYLGIRKDLSHVITFCRTQLQAFLRDEASSPNRELRRIVAAIAA